MAPGDGSGLSGSTENVEEAFLATLRYASSLSQPTSHGSVNEFGDFTSLRSAPIILSRREEEILELLSRGFLHKEIEELAPIGHAVLKKLIGRIYRKFGSHNRTEALNYWRAHRK